MKASVSAAGGRALGMEGAVAAAAAAVFKGSISSCFEPHLKAYVELEERQLSEHLEKIVAEETWDVDEAAQVPPLARVTKPFRGRRGDAGGLRHVARFTPPNLKCLPIGRRSVLQSRTSVRCSVV